jgi:hypothetical protein
MTDPADNFAPTMQRAHTIHIYIRLPEPLDVPENYIIHSYPDGNHYSGRGIRAFVTDDLDVREIMPEGTICRFVQIATHLDLPIDEPIAAAYRMLPSLVPPHSPESPQEPLAPSKTVTIAEILSGAWCDDPDCNGMVGEDNLRISLDLGIELIQRLQRSAHALTRQPYTLVTRRTIPYIVPMAVGTVTPEYFDPPNTLGMWIVHESVLSEVPPAPVENPDLLNRLLPRVTSILFSDHLDLMRESSVAHINRADNRTAAILTGLSCERFLDDLLACILWEEGVHPEDAVRDYKDSAGIVRRVRRSFHSRLPGWQADRGPIEDWRVHIVTIRNLVAHGNYEPSDDEIIRGGDAVVALVNYCSNLLAQQASAGRYIRSAYALMSDTGLRSRSAWNSCIEQVLTTYEESDQWEVLARWKDATNRLRADAFNEGVAPDERSSYLMAVVLPTGGQYFVQHDRVARRARVIDHQIPLAPAQASTWQLLLREIRRSPDFTEPLVNTFFDVPGSPTALTDWVEEYRLVPRAGVMVDGNNLRESDYQVGLH